MRKTPTIAITGANGFLGSALVNYCQAEGWQVIALVRDIAKTTKNPNVTYVHYDLRKPLQAKKLKGVDYLVHTAYVKANASSEDSLAVNVAAAKSLLAAAKTQQLKKVVFISSMSAHEQADSVYGRQKLAIEQLFLVQKGVVLRPGLIIGNGGIVKQMVTFISRFHMVPLVGLGSQPVQAIDLHDLVTAIDNAIKFELAGTLTIAAPEVYTYREFYRALARAYRLKLVFMPVPYYCLLLGLNIMSFVGIRLDFSADNVRGLKKLTAYDTKNDLKKLKIRPINLATSLQQIKTKN